MDDREPIPSDDEVVVIPGHLQESLRAAAERKLLAALDLAFPPDAQDQVDAAVRVMHALTHGEVTGAMVRDLIPAAIEAESGLVEFVERKVALMHELAAFGASLRGGDEA